MTVIVDLPGLRFPRFDPLAALWGDERTTVTLFWFQTRICKKKSFLLFEGALKCVQVGDFDLQLPGVQLYDDPRGGPQPLSMGEILPVLVGHPTNG